MQSLPQFIIIYSDRKQIIIELAHNLCSCYIVESEHSCSNFLYKDIKQ